jgi:hypothetical protein
MVLSLDVVPHRGVAEEQFPGDLLLVLVGCQHGEDLPFARAQRQQTAALLLG